MYLLLYQFKLIFFTKVEYLFTLTNIKDHYLFILHFPFQKKKKKSIKKTHPFPCMHVDIRSFPINRDFLAYFFIPNWYWLFSILIHSPCMLADIDSFPLFTMTFQFISFVPLLISVHSPILQWPLFCIPLFQTRLCPSSCKRRAIYISHLWAWIFPL